MPLEVQDSGKGVILETTASAGEKIPVDEAAKARSNKDLADVDGRIELENQAPDFVSDLNGGNKTA